MLHDTLHVQVRHLLFMINAICSFTKSVCLFLPTVPQVMQKLYQDQARGAKEQTTITE